MPVYFASAVAAAGFSGTATGVKRACLLCFSTETIVPFSTHFLRRVLAMEPTILYLSTRWETEMCLPNLGTLLMILS